MNSENATIAGDDAVGTSADFSLATDLSGAISAGTQVKKQGCVTFEDPDTALTSATLCSGMTPVAASSAPAIDSSGKFSPDWLTQTMISKMQVP